MASFFLSNYYSFFPQCQKKKKKEKKKLSEGRIEKKTYKKNFEGALLLFLYLLPQHLFPQVQYKVMFAQDYS